MAADNDSGRLVDSTGGSMERWGAFAVKAMFAVTALLAIGASPAFAAPPDTQPPRMVLPPNQSVPTTPGFRGAWVYYPPPVVTDNQPGATATCSPASGTFFLVGPSTVTCVATDVAGNKATGSFVVTVVDLQPPTIAPHADVTVGNDPGRNGAIVSYLSPVIIDNVALLSASCSPASGTFFPMGRTSVTCIAMDTSRNTSSGTFNVIVVDRQAPVIGGHANIQVVAAPGASSARVTYALPTATDNEPGVRVSCSPPSGSAFPLGVSTVSCIAADAAGNSSHSSFGVVVTGQPAPTVLPPATNRPPALPITGVTTPVVSPAVAPAVVTTVGPASTSTTLAAAPPTTQRAHKAGPTTTILAAAGPVAGHAASTTPTEPPRRVASVNGGPSVKIAAIGCGGLLLATGVMSLLARRRLDRD